MPFENPPLWVWAIIAGIMVASKLIYRWYATKRLAKKGEKKSKKLIILLKIAIRIMALALHNQR
jgi:hypothetical protein